MSRRDSREAAAKIIFQNEFLDGRLRTDEETDAQIAVEDMIAMFISSADDNEAEKIDRTFIKEILEKTLENIKDIDAAIGAHIDSDWNINRLCKVDLAILREAIAEMKYIDDIPVSVTINEAVELAKKFSYPEAASFINGILGSISRDE